MRLCKLLAVAAAEAKPGFVFEEHLVVAVLIKREAADAIEVDDGRSVNAAKTGGVEILLEFGDAATQHVGSRACVQTCVIVGGLDPVDLRDVEEGNVSRIFDDQAFRCCRSGLCQRNFFPGAVEGEIESRVVEGLEKVVERSGLECTQGVPVVCGDEDDGRWHVAAEKFKHVEAVAFGHLDVEEEKFRFGVADELRRFHSRTAFGEDLNRWIATKKNGKIAPREWFVVHDDRAYIARLG